MIETTALILAAGKGTRMRSSTPKVLVPVSGRPLVFHLLETFERAGIDDRVLVVGHGADEVKATLGDGYRYVMQVEQKGMAHAVSMARPLLDVPDGPRRIVVTVGDSPLLRAETVEKLVGRHEEVGAACSFLTTVFEETPPYARVIRDSTGRVTGCVESHGATLEELAVREVLTSHFVFEARALWENLDAIRPHPVTGELYLTDIVSILLDAGMTVEAIPVPDSAELLGLNTPEEVRWAESWLERHGG